MQEEAINCLVITNAQNAANSILAKIGNTALSGVKFVARGAIHTGEFVAKGLSRVHKCTGKVSESIAVGLAKATLKVADKVMQKVEDESLNEALKDLNEDLKEDLADLNDDSPEYVELKQSVQKLLVYTNMKLEHGKAKVRNYYNQFKEWAGCKKKVDEPTKESDDKKAKASTAVSLVASADYTEKSVADLSVENVESLKRKVIRVIERANPELSKTAKIVLEDFLAPEELKKIVSFENSKSTFGLIKDVAKSTKKFISEEFGEGSLSSVELEPNKPAPFTFDKYIEKYYPTLAEAAQNNNPAVLNPQVMNELKKAREAYDNSSFYVKSDAGPEIRILLPENEAKNKKPIQIETQGPQMGE